MSRLEVSHLYETHFEKEKEAGYPQKEAIFRTVDRLRLIDHIVPWRKRDLEVKSSDRHLVARNECRS